VPEWGLLGDIVVILSVALLLGAFLERFKQSALVGFILAGALCGPGGLGVIDQSEDLKLLSEIGVSLFLFTIGLEFSWRRLVTLGRTAILAGVAQIIVTILVAGGAAHFLGAEPRAAIVLGCAVAMSSTACVLRVLTDRAELESLHGRNVLGVLLVQDMAVIPLMILIDALGAPGTAGEIALDVARTLGAGALLVGAFYFVFHFVVPRLLALRLVSRNREFPIILAVVSAFSSAWLAHEAGHSAPLGAFIAGMLIAASPFALQVRADVSALRTLFLTIFFAAVGMQSSPRWIASHIPELLLLVGVLLPLKTVIATGAFRAAGLPGRPAFAGGLALAQVGEFGFVLAALAQGTTLSTESYHYLTSATILTLLLTPPLVSFAPAIAARLVRRGSSEGTHAKVSDGDASAQAHSRDESVLVIGYGPAGQRCCRDLARRVASVHVLDLNHALASSAARDGFAAHVGDATLPDVIEHLLASASPIGVAIVLIPDPLSAQRIVTALRHASRDVEIVARARYHRHARDLLEAGADLVVDEETEVGEHLASGALRLLRRRERAEQATDPEE